MDTMKDLFAELDAIVGEGSGSRKAEVMGRALEKVEAEHGRDSLEYAAALNELGSCLRAAGDYEQAAERFAQAVEALERTAGPESPECAMATMNYAGALRVTGRLAEALELFGRAEEVFAGTLGEASMEYLTAVNNEALCHQDAGDYEQAIDRHLQVSMALERLEEPSVAYATSLYNTGFCFKRLGEEELGDELIRKSIEAYRLLLPDDHELLEHARAAVAQGEPERP